LAQPQRLMLSIEGDGGIKLSEVLCEVESLVLREMLIGKDQDRVLGRRQQAACACARPISL
jgi:hypothetical protein